MKRSIAALATVVMILANKSGRAVCIAVVLVTGGSASAELITDNFNDGILGSAWQVVEQSGGASWAEFGGTLNVGGFSGQTEGLILRYNMALEDVGSVRIDYNWISYTGHKARVGLGLFSFDSYWDGSGACTAGRCVYIKSVRYTSTGLHAVDGGTGEGIDYHIAYSVPTSGSLLIERDGNSFRASYLDGGNWQVLFEAQHDFAGTPLYPYLFTSNSDSNPSWQVALDNFSADVVVPEPSILVLLSVSVISLLAYAWRLRRA